MKKWIIGAVVVLAAGLIVSTQITLFIIQPIGALPEGKTVVITRMGPKLHFIDSADGLCAREMSGVSLLCRLMATGAVMKEATVIARLPYSEWLYLISTGGKTYEK